MPGLRFRGAARSKRVIAAAAVALALAACHRGGTFIWVDAVPRSIAVSDPTTAIAPGDTIGVRVWNQDANSIDRVKVRDDGRISVPFLNDVEVAGMEPTELARRLEVKLKSFIVNPVVTVVVHERRPTRIAVLGNVTKPGLYDLDARSGVLTALAAAGGLTAFAASDGIYVIRRGYWADGDPSAGRIRFRYDDLRRGSAAAVNFQLRPGDSVVVE